MNTATQTAEKKSAIRRSQEILRDALRQVAEQLQTEGKDAAFLLPLLMEQYSVCVVEYALYGTTIRGRGGIDAVVKASLEPLEKMLREDLAERLKHEDESVRH